MPQRQRDLPSNRTLRCARSFSIPKPPASIPIQGHRLVEIGCIELLNRFPTGADVPLLSQSGTRHAGSAAFKVHGLSIEFLKDKPLFVAHGRRAARLHRRRAVGRAQCDASTSASSTPSSSASSGRLIARERLVDTLMLARRKHSGGLEQSRRSVRALRIDNSQPHQARRAARRRNSGRGLCRADRRAARPTLALPRPSRAAKHASRAMVVRVAAAAAYAAPVGGRTGRARAFIATLGEARSGGTIFLRRQDRLIYAVGAAAGACCAMRWLIERDEIDRIEHQRREAAVAHRWSR